MSVLLQQMTSQNKSRQYFVTVDNEQQTQLKMLIKFIRLRRCYVRNEYV